MYIHTLMGKKGRLNITNVQCQFERLFVYPVQTLATCVYSRQTKRVDRDQEDVSVRCEYVTVEWNYINDLTQFDAEMVIIRAN